MAQIFIIFIFLLLPDTIRRVGKLSSKKEPTRSEVLERRQIPNKISPTVPPSKKIAGPTCQPLHFIPHAETRPVTALASFPGSGNTWLRHLIQETTGVLTGSQFVDNDLMNKGFPGEPVFNASVAVVKTHQWELKLKERFQKAVLLIRNPKSAIQALFNLYSQGHTGCATKKDFERDRGYYWTRFVNKNIYTWQTTNLSWIQHFKGSLHIVMYDELHNNLEATLRSLVKFLDLPLNETALQCTLAHPEGLYHRKPCLEIDDPFTVDMVKRLTDVEKVVLREAERKYGQQN